MQQVISSVGVHGKMLSLSVADQQSADAVVKAATDAEKAKIKQTWNAMNQWSSE